MNDLRDEIDFTAPEPKVHSAVVAWQVFWEGHDDWDGQNAYTDLSVAKRCGVADYIAEEYGWSVEEAAEDTPKVIVWWTKRGNRWVLFTDSDDQGVQETDVQIYPLIAYGMGGEV